MGINNDKQSISGKFCAAVRVVATLMVTSTPDTGTDGWLRYKLNCKLCLVNQM